MTAALIAPLFFTMALLVAHGYFLMGSVPLLILKHDVPMDSRFVRGFYNIYYLAAMFIAVATAVSYGFAGKPAFAVGAVIFAILAALLRRIVLPKMDSLREQIQGNGANAIAAFRRIHVASILVNLAQLALIVWSLIIFSLQLKH
jgi:hypothetical protein